MIGEIEACGEAVCAVVCDVGVFNGERCFVEGSCKRRVISASVCVVLRVLGLAAPKKYF